MAVASIAVPDRVGGSELEFPVSSYVAHECQDATQTPNELVWCTIPGTPGNSTLETTTQNPPLCQGPPSIDPLSANLTADTEALVRAGVGFAVDLFQPLD